MTVMDLETGEVLWVGEGRSKDDFEQFFKETEPDFLTDVMAVAMDMNASYHLVVKKHMPQVQIVYDRYHMQAQFGKDVLGAVRLSEARVHKERSLAVKKTIAHLQGEERKRSKEEARQEQQQYPEDYATMLRVAQEEIDADARPELASAVENMADYDVIFIGYPIWHGRMPQAIYSFMESYDLAGKTVIPFNTHEGTGQSGTQRVMENALPNCTVLQGLAIQGKTAQENEERTRALLTDWLTELNLIK